MNQPEQARQLLTWAKELNCNFVRLAHYPHSEVMTRLADELGVLVWSEVPVYWTIDWTNAATYQNAESQLALPFSASLLPKSEKITNSITAPARSRTTVNEGASISSVRSASRHKIELNAKQRRAKIV